MKDWRYYIEKGMEIYHECRACKERFPSFKEAQKHILEKHEVEIELETCEVCEEIFIKVIESQKRCATQKCICYDKPLLH